MEVNIHMIGVLAQTGVGAGDVVDPIILAGLGGLLAVVFVGIITIIAGFLQERRALSAVVSTNTVQTVDQAQEDDKGGQ
jgi:hypothetical protein